jgi:hypothetical protein
MRPSPLFLVHKEAPPVPAIRVSSQPAAICAALLPMGLPLSVQAEKGLLEVTSDPGGAKV